MNKSILVLAALGALLIAAPAMAQTPLSEETIRMQSLERIFVEREKTMQEREKTLQIALERLPLGGVVVQQAAPQMVQASPEPPSVSSACNLGPIPCVAQIVASMGSGGVEIIKSLAGPAAQVITGRDSMKASVANTKEMNITARVQSGDNNKTLQTAFGSIQAPGAVTNNSQSGTGVLNTGSGGATYVGPVNRNCVGGAGQAGAGASGTPTVPGIPGAPASGGPASC